MRRMVILGCAALSMLAVGTVPSDARRSSAYKSRKHSVRARTFVPSRGTTSGECPCNGGDVCVGPRGGRYCLTSSGNKRYGV